MKPIPTEEALWSAIEAIENETFYTTRGLKFYFVVLGGELFVSRKQKSITRSTVYLAFRRVQELGPDITGPKSLNCFGATYLYAIFQQLGLLPLRPKRRPARGRPRKQPLAPEEAASAESAPSESPAGEFDE